jgi:hypothetical protein
LAPKTPGKLADRSQRCGPGEAENKSAAETPLVRASVEAGERKTIAKRAVSVSLLRMHLGFQRELDELSDGFWTAWNRALL